MAGIARDGKTERPSDKGMKRGVVLCSIVHDMSSKCKGILSKCDYKTAVFFLIH